MKARGFNVGLTWSLESDREHELVIKGTAQPYIPAIVSGPADNWAPAEGGELEDLEIYCVYGGKLRRLPRSVEEKIADDEAFIEKVSDALQEE